MVRRQDMPDLFGRHLGLTPVQAAIVARLHRAGNSWIDTATLNADTADASRLHDHAAPLRLVVNVRVQIHSIRQKLGDEFILGHFQRGFTLGAPGVLACKRLIREALDAGRQALQPHKETTT